MAAKNEAKLDNLNKKDLLIAAKDFKNKHCDLINTNKLLMEKISSLESVAKKDNENPNGNTNKILMKKIKKLEERLDEAEERIYENEIELNKLNQYTRRENIEITGISKNIKQNDLEATVLKIFHTMGITCTSYDIAACHRLKQRDQEGNQTTIVRFVCRKKALEILRKKNL